MRVGVFLALAALALGSVLEVGLWGHRAGAGWMVVTLAAGVVVLALQRRLERTGPPWALLLWFCAACFSAGLLVYD
ncbi:MAG: hypothetical protein AB1758_24435, partial [Candidatus Eremiobacterota bacterium]